MASSSRKDATVAGGSTATAQARTTGHNSRGVGDRDDSATEEVPPRFVRPLPIATMGSADDDGPRRLDEVVVSIRPLRESDASAAAKIWRDGLSQTTRHAVPWIFRSLAAVRSLADEKMGAMRDEVLSEDGDVGPDGANLVRTYREEDGRRMFVACVPDDGSGGSSSSSAGYVVVGCCGVKRGMDEYKSEPESNTASIWRMSVDESHRGRGVATQLMNASEEYARAELGCAKVTLLTVNPIAINFYMNRRGYRRAELCHHIIDNWIGRLLFPPVYRYEKHL